MSLRKKYVVLYKKKYSISKYKKKDNSSHTCKLQLSYYFNPPDSGSFYNIVIIIPQLQITLILLLMSTASDFFYNICLLRIQKLQIALISLLNPTDCGSFYNICRIRIRELLIILILLLNPTDLTPFATFVS